MVQLLLTIGRALRPLSRFPEEYGDAEPWRRDPLAHPVLRTMSQRELGDLPIGHPRR